MLEEKAEVALILLGQSLSVRDCGAFICYSIQPSLGWWLHRACVRCSWVSPLCDTVCPTGRLVCRDFLVHL